MFTGQNEVTAVGVRCRRVSDDRWSYLSLAPWPRLSPDGTPMLSLLVAGDGAFVQLSAQLDPPGNSLEQLRAALAVSGPATSLKLTSAVLAVQSVELTACAAHEKRVIATSASSGFAPFVAVFALQTELQEREAFEAALDGQQGKISITYNTETSDGLVRISADLADWARIA